MSESSRHLAASGHDGGRARARASQPASQPKNRRDFAAQRSDGPGRGLVSLSLSLFPASEVLYIHNRGQRRRRLPLFLTRVVRQARSERSGDVNAQRLRATGEGGRRDDGSRSSGQARARVRGRGGGRKGGERETASGSAGTRYSEKWRRRFAR